MLTEKTYLTETVPLERAGVALHLDYMRLSGAEKTARNILLIHGVTYSSHKFDINYEDYSLARRLADEGFAVWRLDIAGYGRSGAVTVGFLPDSDYAAADIGAAVEAIHRETGCGKTDLLGWSWGTVTAGRYASAHPERINRLVLYAPILCGTGRQEIKEPFHHNSWEHAADDFQRCADGSFDLDAADPVVIELLCSGCWHYDGEFSPNGGRRDICADRSVRLIDLGAIKVPTLIICGDRDPYVDHGLLYETPGLLPEGSKLEVIEGASHVAMLEKPYHRDFIDRLMRFLAPQSGDNV